MGKTQLYVYCNIIAPQRVGDQLAPLLRKFPFTGTHDEIISKSFNNPQYIDVASLSISNIHMWIRTEDGVPPPIKLGSFSATLHFRRKKFFV